MHYAARHDDKDLAFAPAPSVAPALAVEQNNKAAAQPRAQVPFSMARNLIAFDLLSLTAAPLAASLVAAFAVRVFMPGWRGIEAFSSAHASLYAPLMLVGMVMLWNKGLYTQRVPWWNQIRYIGKSFMFVCLIDAALNASLDANASLPLILLTWMCAFTLAVSLRWALGRIAGKICLWRIPTVVIGNKAMAADLLYAFHADPGLGYDVRTVFLRDRDCDDFDLSSLPFACRKIQVRDGMADYDSYIRQNPKAFYIVSLDSFRGETRDRLVRSLEQAGAAFAIVPSTSAVGLYAMEPHYFFGHDIMMLQPTPPQLRVRNLAARFVKRSIDVAVSGLALLMLSPLLIGVAVMLKLEGQGGSVFYGCKRIGYKGRRFGCWKFRSMEPDSDHLLQARLEADPAAREQWEKFRKLPDDPRVTTRTARFIRKASIDELPQLWNVLVGDMSLVGPRPILEDEVSYFGDALRDYLSVRPGLTGLWQVSGRNATSFLRRVYWDRWYVRNWSLWSDIVILVKTPFVLLTGHGAS
jgi:Undecaprenyl-phosphate galactose phosphotransferase WbaP